MMNKAALMFAVFLVVIFCAAPQVAGAQAAVEAGAISASVSGLTSVSSHRLVPHISNRLPQQSAATVVHRTQSPQTKGTITKKSGGRSSIATATASGPKQQGHIVGVWPPGALTKPKTDSQ